jgi:hypothetical protein
MKSPEHFSHSQISAWLRCAKAYQLSRLVGVPERPAVYLVAGNAMHDVIEQINREFFRTRQSSSFGIDSKMPTMKDDK